MATPKIFRVWGASRIFDFFRIFFLKVQHKILQVEIQLIFFHPLGIALVKSRTSNTQKLKIGIQKV